MMKFIKKHPIVSIGAALAAAWVLFGSKTAQASPQPGPSPSPQPAPAPPAPAPTSTLVLIAPGNMSPLSIPWESSFTLQLPAGATWGNATGLPSVSQSAAASVLGGTVYPLVPPAGSNMPQVWTNVSGQGTIFLDWTDASGAQQSSNFFVQTTGAVPNIGGA